MPVQLSVVNEQEEGDTPSDYIFDEDRITIGRAEENHLTLSDPRRVVSSKHAMLRRDGATFRLVDRGSKNFTYVGSQRITAQSSYELSDGDVFRIGDFRIQFHVLAREPQPAGTGGETVFDHTFTNPFAEPAAQFVEALDHLAETYEQATPQRRDDALEDALDEEGGRDVGSHEAVQQVLSVLGERSEVASTTRLQPSDSEPEPTPPKISLKPETEDEPKGEAKGEVVDEVLDALAEALATVVRIPWQFRHEFIGQTVMQAQETQFLYQGEAIKEHLLASDLSADERAERIGYVEDAAEAVVVHQVAMLNGYKASVMKGAETLLERLNPDVHEEEVLEQQVLFEYLPILASPLTLGRLRAEWEELQQGEGSAAEQRIFRPAFTKAYLARMTAPRSEESSDSGSAPSQPK